MKVIGGSLGPTGSAVIGGERLFVKVPTGERKYSRADIAELDSEVITTRQFSVGSFVLGVVVLGALGWAVMGLVGAVGAVVLSVIGSWRKSTDRIAHVRFNDGQHVSLTGTPRAMKKLAKLSG